MRTFTLGTKVLTAVISAFALLTVMQRPWYGPRPAPRPDALMDLGSPVNSVADALGRWFGEPAGISAWQAFASADLALAALAACAGGAAICCLIPALEQTARPLLQLCALGTCGLLALKFIDQPGQNATVEPRYGLFLALALAVVLLVTASGINAAPATARRRRAVAAYNSPSTNRG